MKRCGSCKQVKPVSKFYKDLRSKRRGNDGLQSSCKVCKKKASQTKKYKEYQRKYHQTEKCKITKEKYRLRHPEYHLAERAVSNAIRDGRLRPPTDFKCTYCPKQAKEYHHPSYTPEHWLDVEPVCKKCHKILPSNR